MRLGCGFPLSPTNKYFKVAWSTATVQRHPHRIGNPPPERWSPLPPFPFIPLHPWAPERRRPRAPDWEAQYEAEAAALAAQQHHHQQLLLRHAAERDDQRRMEEWHIIECEKISHGFGWGGGAVI